MQSTRRNVGRHQNLVTAFLKSAQGTVALRLRAVAVNHGRGETVAFQFLGQPLRAALGAGENQRLSFFLVEQLPQHVQLFGGRTSYASSCTLSAGFNVEPSATRTGSRM